MMRIVNPPELSAPVGFSHAVVAGDTVYLGGQTAHDKAGVIPTEDLVEQYEATLANVVTVLRAAGAGPGDLVSMTIYTTQPAEYRARLGELGAAHRRHLGRHYPATAFFAISELFDPAAKIE